MNRPVAGFLGTLVLAVAICSGQIPNTIEIQLPSGVASESVFVRYVLTGEEIGGWVQPRPGVSSYFISTIHNGRPATRIKALLYAPGCAIQAIDVPLSESSNQPYSFECRPLPPLRVTGTFTRSDRLYGREVRLQAKYVARWAQSFLGVDDIPEIPVGDGTVTGLRVHIPMPDLSQDPLANDPNFQGELQIWARDKTSGDIVAQLIPAGFPALKTHMGGLKIQSEYPSELVFAFCSANPSGVHDAFGFALRPDAGDACDR